MNLILHAWKGRTRCSHLQTTRTQFQDESLHFMTPSSDAC